MATSETLEDYIHHLVEGYSEWIQAEKQEHHWIMTVIHFSIKW